MKNKAKSKKTPSAKKPRPKPYTIQQEQDTVVGKIIYWTFLFGTIIVMLLSGTLSDNEAFMPICTGIWLMLFGLFVLIGLVFKLDCARVAAAEQNKEYRNVLSRPWGKKDKRNCLGTGIAYFVLGLALAICGAFLNIC